MIQPDTNAIIAERPHEPAQYEECNSKVVYYDAFRYADKLEQALRDRDAEIERLHRLAELRHGRAEGQMERADKAERELAEARAENERLQAQFDSEWRRTKEWRRISQYRDRTAEASRRAEKAEHDLAEARDDIKRLKEWIVVNDETWQNHLNRQLVRADEYLSRAQVAEKNLAHQGRQNTGLRRRVHKAESLADEYRAALEGIEHWIWQRHSAKPGDDTALSDWAYVLKLTIRGVLAKHPKENTDD